jgi:hypothetical protein
MSDPFTTREYDADVCVGGGGMAGFCAAIAAARHGATTVLINDRPMLGGNASSEFRLHICGADVHGLGKNMRETGILEELRLENLRRNPHWNYSVWDTLLYEKAMSEENLTLLLNTSINAGQVEGGHLASVSGWQSNAEITHTVRARTFIDCSGDGVLAPITGAETRTGREGRDEYDESLAPEQADTCTMGHTVWFQTKQYDTPQPFEALPWAYTFESCKDLYEADGHGTRKLKQGFWWMEYGGQPDVDTITDTDAIREELMKIAWGVWDHLKNHCPDGRETLKNHALDWISFLPGKRESRRYVGLYVLNQNDCENGTTFDDGVAYGGWSMDDHSPLGFWGAREGVKPTHFHRVTSGYHIPLRALISKDVPNLMFAGRCHSATHMAMSSTRVMGTGCAMGQAAGTAAAMAIDKGIEPADMVERADELQQTLLYDDCYITHVPQRFSETTMQATLSASQGEPAPLRDGTNRPVHEDTHAWTAKVGDWAALEFDGPTDIEQATLIVDTEMERSIQMSYALHDDSHLLRTTPARTPKRLRIDVKADGDWSELTTVENNTQRVIRLPVGRAVEGVRATLLETHGGDASQIYAFYVE